MEGLADGLAQYQVFVVHGEESTAVSFANHVSDDLGLEAVAPYSGDTYDLLTGACIVQGARR